MSWRTWPVGATAIVAIAVASALTFHLASESHDRGTLHSANPRIQTPAPGPTQLSVQFSGAGGLLVGATLTSPPGPRPLPAVLIVPDTGAADRDGLTPPGQMSDPLYADLARVLATHGVTTLRYDPRGQGQSVLPPGDPLKFSDLATDARAGLAFLAGRVAVDPHRLAVIGEGVGGLVAMSVAADDPSVRAAVLVSTPGRPVVDIVADQLRAAAPDAAAGQALVAQLHAVVAGLLAGQSLPSPAQLPSPLLPVFPAGQEAFLRSLFSFDPPAVAHQLRVPVLIVRGGADPGTTQADTASLAAAIGARAKVIVAGPADHTLQITTLVSDQPDGPPSSTAQTGMEVIHRPDRSVTLRDTKTLDSIAAWLTTNL